MGEGMKTYLINRKLVIRRLFLMVLDCALIGITSFFALFIRFDFSIGLIPLEYTEGVLLYFPFNVITTLLLFYAFRLYHSLWKYAGVDELVNILFACIIAGFCQMIGMRYLLDIHVPRSYFPLSTVSLVAMVSVSRFCYRYVRKVSRKPYEINQKRIMVIGAGEAGHAIIREVEISGYVKGKVICVIDDNKEKLGRYMQGIKVIGDRTKIGEAVVQNKITDIFIAMPSAPRKTIRQIIEICKETGCTLKILPGMYQLINEEVSITTLRSVEIEDLLGREPVKIDLEDVMNHVKNKTIMVTGGGGSIGSELCRQIAKNSPGRLIILDIYENNAYFIQQELKNTYPELEVITLIASVRNTKRIDTVLETYHPHIIYHAAAHKHVPLMEESPNEAVKNNVGGTYKLAQAAVRHKVEKVILISSDKAVNPTNVMGATKRICEMIIQVFNTRSTTEFVAVRFGNVLGSNGSVIPLFKEQILKGGPVTVTHPDIIRYFMTIPEAVSLVLQASAFAKGGEIFVLDMGEPIKIKDLAENLIRLSGYEPNHDIMIVYTGLRPGEKLYEELLMDEEGLQNTENTLIHIGKPLAIDENKFLAAVEELDREAKDENKEIRHLIKKLVPTYMIASEPEVRDI